MRKEYIDILISRLSDEELEETIKEHDYIKSLLDKRIENRGKVKQFCIKTEMGINELTVHVDLNGKLKTGHISHFNGVTESILYMMLPNLIEKMLKELIDG